MLYKDSEIERALLIEPLRGGCDELHVLSGYASPQTVYSLLAREGADSLNIKITIGMVVADGISLGAHRGFVALQTVDYPGRVRTRYVVRGKPVHTKLYVWCKARVPHVAFAGSANFTRNGVHGGYREVLVPADPVASMTHLRSINAGTLGCDDPSFPKDLVVVSTRRTKRLTEVATQDRPWVGIDAGYVDIPLINSRMATGVAYGLNWGQRPGRDHNQSYLPVPAPIARSGFLPPRGKRFTLLTSDGQALSAVVAQDGSKAIETPDSNAIMGRFIRAELGLPSGALIIADHLKVARKTAYRLYALDDETYAIELGDFDVAAEM